MAKKALAPSIPVTARDAKGRKFISIIETAYNKAELSDDEAQRVNEASGLSDLVGKFIAENRSINTFKNEEVASKYGYLSGYKPEGDDLEKQIAVLQELFPGLGGANSEYLQKIKNGEISLPKHAEKWFAIPNLQKHPDIFGKSYSQVLQKVLDVIKMTRNGKFYNYRDGQIDEKHIRQTERTKKFFQDLADIQGDPDIIIVAAQFGIRHAGRSVRRARVVFLINEFGLGSFAVGCMLLTHAERLQHYNDLWIDCAGDEFSGGTAGVFDEAPVFDFSDGKLGFGTSYVDDANGRYGSAPGFLPPQ